MTAPLTIVGRSSSHFTRIVSIFAEELGVACRFEPVFDIKSREARVFGENPLLRVPSLRTPEGTWFGSLNACRELARRSASDVPIVWPEDLTEPAGANAQEIVTDAMGTGVVIVLARVNGFADDVPLLEKPLARLSGALAWLEANLAAVLASLPERRLSFLEVSAFCFLTHLEFRELGHLDGSRKLQAFCSRFGARPSAAKTTYHFDQPPAPASA